MALPAAYILPYNVVSAAFRLAKEGTPFAKQMMLYGARQPGAAVAAACSGPTAGYYGDVIMQHKPAPTLVKITGPLGVFADMAGRREGEQLWMIVMPEQKRIAVASLCNSIPAAEIAAAAFSRLGARHEIPAHAATLVPDTHKLISEMRNLARRASGGTTAAVIQNSDMGDAVAFLKNVGASMFSQPSNGVLVSRQPSAMVRVSAIPAICTSLDLPKRFG